MPFAHFIALGSAVQDGQLDWKTIDSRQLAIRRAQSNGVQQDYQNVTWCSTHRATTSGFRCCDLLHVRLTPVPARTRPMNPRSGAKLAEGRGNADSLPTARIMRTHIHRMVRPIRVMRIYGMAASSAKRPFPSAKCQQDVSFAFGD